MNRIVFMYRHYLLLIMALCLLMPLRATHRALIIGIGPYPESTGWAPINGDKDVALVEEMLVNKGFDRRYIVKLTNEQATADGIRNALRDLVEASGMNDHVYIHFSGHGQRITDTNGDEPGGYDEAWVPYDAQLRYNEGTGLIFKTGGYAGQNHLIDDELNEYLYQIRQKVGDEGKIIVIADACHSGGGTRGLDDDEDEEQFVIRGSSDDFIIPSPSKSPKVGGHEVDWIFVSACKSTQCNYEYHGSGSLTYAMLQLSDMFNQLSCNDLQIYLRDIMRKIIPFVQTPTVETNHPDSKFL